MATLFRRLAVALTLFIGLGIAAAGWAPGARADSPPLTVVELFTSQGCSSCPPADALLGDLASDPAILALSEHVDYWDYLGWRDPFAQARFTDRQRAYVRRLGLRHAYTPQMIINGSVDIPGSRRAAVLAAIGSAAKLAPISIGFDLDDPDQPRVLIGPGDAGAPADVWFVAFDRRHSTDVGRGENRGRKIDNHNVVRRFERIGDWSGEPVTLEIPFEGQGDTAAVLVQVKNAGRILAAGRVPRSDR